jgi:hypothetical protein
MQHAAQVTTNERMRAARLISIIFLCSSSSWHSVVSRLKWNMQDAAPVTDRFHYCVDVVHHSMIWSARRSTDCGIVNPSALAVLRLMTSSNFVACCTGRSAGFAPFRILST